MSYRNLRMIEMMRYCCSMKRLILHWVMMKMSLDLKMELNLSVKNLN